MGLRSLSLYSSWHQLHVDSTRNVSPTLGIVFAVSTLFEKLLQLSALDVSSSRAEICSFMPQNLFKVVHILITSELVFFSVSFVKASPNKQRSNW